MSFVRDFKGLTPAQRHTFVASFLGWTLDALDFFLLIFCVKAIATDFGAKPSAVLGAVFLTQAFRPVGALIFGMLADRFGRKPILMINILSFSVIELACAFAPSLAVLMVLRALFGIAMGGEWGVGAALAFETLPKEGRGGFSGILQEGYAFGSILASGAFALFFHAIGWRGLFILGASPALLVFYVQARVGESPVWLARQQKRRDQQRGLAEVKHSASLISFLPRFLFLILLMTAFMTLSHGTQDVYPTFLEVQIGLTPRIVGLIGVFYGFAADSRGLLLWNIVGKVGPETRHYRGCNADDPSDPAVGIWSFGHHSGYWRCDDAVYGAGCLGRRSCVSYRANARTDPGHRAGTRISIRGPGDFVECQSPGVGGGAVGKLLPRARHYGSDRGLVALGSGFPGS